MTNRIFFNVNGTDVTVDDLDPETSLASYLRNTLGLTGTKIACGEGACGACTVVIGSWREGDQKPSYRAVNACTTPLFLADGQFVITVEGVGTQQRIHAIQDRLARGHATQCGFCSPGFVMSAYALLRMHPQPTRKQIDQSIKGNLCRCTGYRPIVESLYSFSQEACCGGAKSGGCPCKDSDQPSSNQKLISFKDFPKIDPSQELIYPPSLKVRDEPASCLFYHGSRVRLFCPNTIQEAAELKGKHQGSKFVTTAMITRLNIPSESNQEETWISTYRIEELNEIQVVDGLLRVGSAVSLGCLADAVDAHCSAALAIPIRKLFDKYSSQQTFNLASWVGSLFVGGDFSTLVRALSLQVEVVNGAESANRMTWTTPAELLPDDLIIAICIPTDIDSRRLWTFKAGHRHGPDSTIVSCAAVVGEDKTRLIFGLGQKQLIEANHLATTLHARISAGSSSDDVDVLFNAVEQDLSDVVPSEAFLERGLIRAAVFQLDCFLRGEKEMGEETTFNSTQIYNAVSASQSEGDAVGRPLAHVFADRSTTGEAVFVTDIHPKDAVYLGFVLSTESHADILSVDTSEAMAMKGVLGYFDVQTLLSSNGTNQPGLSPFVVARDDTPIFAEGKVESQGQPIGVIAASSPEVARRAAALVHVNYRPLPAILTVKEALEKKSYVVDPKIHGVSQEEVDKALEGCTLILEGEVSVGGQEHMYLEPQAAVVIPMEGGEFTIYSSTQAGTAVQNQTAAVLGIPANKVVVKVKRVGGAFGGKTSQSVFVAGAAALVARSLGRPAVAAFSREEDCRVTGKRHPAIVKYRVGITAEGRMEAASMTTVLDAGYSIDNSEWVMFVASSLADACYHIPVMRNEGLAVKTNKNSNTAFRGYGQPQAFFAMNSIIHHIAHTVLKTPEEIRELNFNNVGGTTMFGNIIQNDAMLDCWHELKEFASFNEKQAKAEEFNSSSRFVKRGVAMATTRFGLTHAGPYEQASALVQIYLDGSIAISIGGVEMGQGLASKCVQVASRALGVPLSRINLLDASTDKTCSVPETGGSQGADIHGRAIQMACDRLLQGIDPILKSGKTWDEAVMEAYLKRLPLQASEHARIDRAEFGLPEARPTYYTTGAACVEAEVDTLTGDHKLLSVDIVMDCGQSLNPAIDIGQIEGGFMQGYGYLTCEDVKFDDNGKLLSDSMSSYKIPSVAMTPNSFRVKLLGKSPNYPGQVYSSKGIGEPPLLLGTAAFSAIRAAVASRLEDMGKNSQWIQIDAPLTRAYILELCKQ